MKRVPGLRRPLAARAGRGVTLRGMETPAANLAAPNAAPHRRPLRRSEYDRLVELGAFRDEKLELLEGDLVPMSPHGSEHALAIQVLTRLFARTLDDSVWVRVQLPLAAAETSEPEPDLAVVPSGEYGGRHPDTALLVIEVASSSVREDLERKARLYARAQVDEYWVIDVATGSATVHLGRAEGRWTSVALFGREAVLTPRALPQVQVRLADLLRKR